MASLPCAFSFSSPLLAPSASSSPFTTRALPRPLHSFTAPLPRRTVLKRPRINNCPRAQFNQNGNGSDERFRKQTADFLLTAGRFFQSSTGQVVLWGTLVWLVLTGRIGVLFDSFLILFAFVTIVPVIAVVAFRWWVGRQIVQGVCPNCNSVVTGLKGQSFPCSVCGNDVTPEADGDFSVKDPSSATIDIDAKQVDDW